MSSLGVFDYSLDETRRRSFTRTDCCQAASFDSAIAKRGRGCQARPPKDTDAVRSGFSGRSRRQKNVGVAFRGVSDKSSLVELFYVKLHHDRRKYINRRTGQPARTTIEGNATVVCSLLERFNQVEKNNAGPSAKTKDNHVAG